MLLPVTARDIYLDTRASERRAFVQAAAGEATPEQLAAVNEVASLWCVTLLLDGALTPLGIEVVDLIFNCYEPSADAG